MFAGTRRSRRRHAHGDEVELGSATRVRHLDDPRPGHAADGEQHVLFVEFHDDGLADLKHLSQVKASRPIVRQPRP